MEANEDFFFGDLSEFDLSGCEELSLDISSTKSTKRTTSKNAINIALSPVTQPTITTTTEAVAINPAKILTVKQAAEYLQLRTETILRKIYAGELAAIKVGRIWRLRQSQIDDYLNRNIVQTK